MRRAWKWAAAVVALLIALVTAAVLALPGFVRATIEERGSAMLGRTVRVQAVEFGPGVLAFTARDLRVAAADAPDAADAAPQLRVARIHLAASLGSLWQAAWQLTPVFDELEFDAPALRLARVAPGRLDVDDVVERLRGAPRPPPAAGQSLPRFRLRNIRILQGTVAFEDRLVGRRIEVTELQLDLPRLEHVPGEEPAPVDARLALRLEGTPIILKARSRPLAPDRATELELELQRLDLAPWWAYAEALAGEQGALPLRLARGGLEARLTAQAALPPGRPLQLTVRGLPVLTEVALATRAGAPLLSFGRLALPIEQAVLHERRLALGEIRLDAAAAELRRDAAGRVELAVLASAARRAGAPPGAATAAATSTASGVPSAPAATPAAAAPASALPPWQVSVARVQVAGAQVRWQDAATRPAAALRLEGIEAAAGPLRWPATEPAPIAVEATVADVRGPVASLRADGQLSPRQATLRFELAQARLEAAAPYLRALLLPALAGRAQARGNLEWAAPADGRPGRLQAALSSLQVDGLALTEAGEREPAVRVRTLRIDGLDADVAARRLRVASVRLQAPLLRAEREADGSLRMQRWVTAAAAGAPTAAPRATAAPAWQWSVGRAQVDAAALHWIDRARPGGEPVELRADVARASVQGLAMPTRAPVQVQLEASLQPPTASSAPPGRVAARGQLQLAPLGWRGAVELERLPVHALEPYYADLLPVRLANAELGWRGEADLARDEAGLRLDARGDVLVADLDVRARGAGIHVAEGQRLLGWQSLTLRPLAVSVAPGRKPRLEVGQAQVNDLSARLVITEEGRLNLTTELARRSPERERPAAASSPAAPAAAARGAGDSAPAEGPPIDLVIGSTSVVNAHIDFNDYFIRPNYSADLTELNGTIGRITSESREMATVELRGRAAGTALLEIRGAVNPAVRPPQMDLSARATDLELAPLSPYAGKYAGYAIERGKLSLDVAYRIDPDGRLEARNQLILNQLTFGDKVDSPSATKLPVRLAVALLADRNGVIDIDLPISGTVNDPQFSFWGIVWKVVGNLLAKAVTAPFALMMGGEGTQQSWVEFVPGTATVAPASVPVIDKVAKALADRPRLRMTVIGSADAAAEREAIQAATLEARVQAEQRRELARAGQAVAPDVLLPALTPADRERIVRRLYADTPIPDKPRNAIGLVRTLPLPETEDRLRRHVAVSDTTARELAIQRGLAVRDALIAKGLPSERLFLGAPRVRGSADDDTHWTPRVSLTLDAP